MAMQVDDDMGLECNIDLDATLLRHADIPAPALGRGLRLKRLRRDLADFLSTPGSASQPLTNGGNAEPTRYCALRPIFAAITQFPICWRFPFPIPTLSEKALSIPTPSTSPTPSAVKVILALALTT